MKSLIILFALLIPSLLFCQDDDVVFKVVEEMPRFPGCEDDDCSKEKLIEYIYTNLEYPEEAKKAAVEGTVVIQFVVDTDGSIINTKIVRDIGKGCGEAALAVVNNMTVETRDTITSFDEDTYTERVQVIGQQQLWRPGYQRGKAVKVLYTLPVKYKLAKEDQTTNPIKNEQVKSDQSFTNYPPEYRSYQHYKDEVLIPSLVKEVYQVAPIEANKIVGDIIPYGEAMHPILKKMGRHNGIDFRAVPGVAIMATADGIIEAVGTDHERYGKFIKVKHSEETLSLYAHLSSINVTQGQSIKAGDHIGAVGQSGSATYPHLHYEVHINGQTENPIIDEQDSKLAIEEKPKRSHLKLNNTADMKPLIVIDGEIQESNFTVEMLKGEDIQSMNVIKNESAILKYGNAARNGAVEITLKTTTEQQQEIVNVSDVRFDLKQNFPNPFFDDTTISFNLPNNRPASLLFYNQSGEYVYGLKNSFTQGYNEVKISTADLNASGMIYYFLIQDNMTAVNKMIVSKR